jgi:hypothetical protein
MRVVVAGVFAGVVLLAFSGQPREAVAQQGLQPIGAVGRYQVVGGSNNLVLVDTQTGRSWLFCNTSADSLKSRAVDMNWCAMQLYGTATRP